MSPHTAELAERAAQDFGLDPAQLLAVALREETLAACRAIYRADPSVHHWANLCRLTFLCDRGWWQANATLTPTGLMGLRAAQFPLPESCGAYRRQITDLYHELHDVKGEVRRG